MTMQTPATAEIERDSESRSRFSQIIDYVSGNTQKHAESCRSRLRLSGSMATSGCKTEVCDTLQR